MKPLLSLPLLGPYGCFYSVFFPVALSEIGSHFACHNSAVLCDTVWGEGSQDITLKHKPLFKSHPSALVIWFAKYSHSHTLLPLLSISVILPPFLNTLLDASGFETRRFDLHEGLGLCIWGSSLRVCVLSSTCGVCAVVYANAAWSWSSGSDWRWQSGGRIVWASSLSSTDGRRERAVDRRRGPPSTASLHFQLHSPVRTPQTHYETSFCEYWFPSRLQIHWRILSSCHEWTEWGNNWSFLAFPWIIYFLLSLFD